MYGTGLGWSSASGLAAMPGSQVLPLRQPWVFQAQGAYVPYGANSGYSANSSYGADTGYPGYQSYNDNGGYNGAFGNGGFSAYTGAQTCSQIQPPAYSQNQAQSSMQRPPEVPQLTNPGYGQVAGGYGGYAPAAFSSQAQQGWGVRLGSFFGW